MRIEFTADTATFDEVDEALVAGLAVGDGTEAYLLFQRSAADGPDDLGVHLEYNDQATSAYNLISACRLSRRRVEVDLSGSLGSLRGVEGFDVVLAVDDEAFKRFADGLTRVFRGEASARLSGGQSRDMMETPIVESCDLCIAATRVTINGTPIHVAGSVASFYSLLGQPQRVVPTGPPAPVGHRNNHVHYYDHLGITLSEHHYTYQIQAITAVLNTTDAIHPTGSPFSGALQIGGVHVAAGDTESDLKGSAIRFLSRLPGSWSADVQSAPTDGHRIHVSIDTKARKLPSGRRSKIREIISVQLSLEHDPWDTTQRPHCSK